MKRLLAVLALGSLLYGASGWYSVGPDELAVVRRFGRVLDPPQGPGAHLGLPWGLDRVDRIKPREVKRVTVGPLRFGRDAIDSTPAQFLTGDRNLVNIRATAQYAISDPTQFLFQSDSVAQLVHRLTETATADVLCGQPVDRVLTRGKLELGILARDQLQSAVDEYQLGIIVRSVDFGAAEPPLEVAAAFNDVITALREKQQSIHDANSYARRAFSQGQAGAQRLRDESSAHQSRVVRRAEGEAESFERLLAEYERAPDLTARRLYLETMAATLPRLRSKLIVATERGVDLSIVREADK